MLPSDDVCIVCPKCGTKEVNTTVITDMVTYCRCRACGHIWHIEIEQPVSGAVTTRPV